MAESNPVGRDKHKSRVDGLQGYGEGVEFEGVYDERVKILGCMVKGNG